MHATYENASGYQDNVPSPLLKWSAVFGGLVLGLAMLLLLSSLWLALAYGSEVDTIRDNLGGSWVRRRCCRCSSPRS